MSFARKLFLIILLQAFSIAANERILSFDSDIAVNKDSTVDIIETITILAEGRQIKHGIMREFPIHYKDRFGHAYTIRFTLHSAQQKIGPNGAHNVRVKTLNKANGIVMYLGDPDVVLKPGVYTYVINYTVTRVLGFFKEFDELYWNATGNGWRLPIDQATATVTLPAGIPTTDLLLDAYTGPFGSTGKNFALSIEPSGKVIFKTTRPLLAYHGLTIAVSWPKKIVLAPDSITKALWFLSDNLGVLITLIGWLIVFLLYLMSWLDVRRKNRPGTIIPLFNPPADKTLDPSSYLLPSEVRFLYHMGYDTQTLSSEIVNLSVLGYITIEYVRGFFKGTYTLKRTQKPSDQAVHVHQLILNELFSSGRSQIELTQSNANILSRLANKVTALLKKSVQATNFSTKSDTIIHGVLASVLTLLAAFAFGPGSFGILGLAFACLLIVTNTFFAFHLTYYTQEGRNLMDQIEGFRLFLSTTETPRLDVIGTPPRKTPELYEKYLPYAMALGVEKQWTKQFTPVFEKLKERGTPYYPIWYYGPVSHAFDAPAFSSNLNSSLTSAISSSVQAPGTSSGSRGGGSSGGGGGGGGGGGW